MVSWVSFFGGAGAEAGLRVQGGFEMEREPGPGP